MNSKENTNKSQTTKHFTKQTLSLLFCIVMLALSATACYTTTKCPAYGHYSQAEITNK